MNKFILEITPQSLRKIAKKILVKLNKYTEPMPAFLHHSVNTYSQHQEDLIIDALLSSKPNGIYVDIGANHPEILSNTKRFYDRGWTGINVEPIAENYEFLIKSRARDINLNIGVGAEQGELTFYQVAKNNGVYSGFDKKNVLKYAKESEIVERKIPILNLMHIYQNYLQGKTVDFLSIDVEGLEIEVLSGNDWNVFRPSLLIIEFGNAGQNIVQFLEGKDFKYIYGNGTNGIFVDTLGS